MLLSLTCSATGQQVMFSADAERLFDNGLEDFRGGRYASASVTFNAIVTKYPDSHRATAAYLMAAESYFKESKYDSTIKILRPMFLLYSGSSLLPRAAILMAESYSRSGDGFNSLLSAFVALQTATDSDTAAVAQSARNIIARWGTPRMFDSLLVIFDEKNLRDLVSSSAAMYSRGQPAGGAKETKRKNGSTVRTYRIGVLMRKFDNEPGRTVVRELRQGIRAALDHRKDHPRVRVDIDSQYYRDENEIHHIFRKWKNDDRMIACIGGVFTEDTKSLLRMFDGATLPILIPLANGSGLETGGMAFLLNSSLQERARSAALFCATTLNANRAGVLAPLSDLGKNMANAFIDEATRLGMRVRGVSWYKPNTMNFIPHFTSLKNALESEDTLDVLYVPLGGLGDRSRRIISALKQVDFHTCLIGSDEWQYSRSDWSVLLDGTKMYCTASIFPSTGTPKSDDLTSGASKVRISEGYIMGYNAMRIIMRMLDSGAETRVEIANGLKEAGLITGFKTAISLSSKGQNLAVLILRFEGKEFKLEKIIDRTEENR